MTLTLAVLPNKTSQGSGVGLRPNRAALQAGVVALKLRAALQRDGEESQIIRSKYDGREILFARPSDLSFRDFCSAAFETGCHRVKSANK